MKKRIISFILCVAMCCVIFPASAFAAGAEPQHEENLTPVLATSWSPLNIVDSSSYMSGSYFDNLKKLFTATTGYNGQKPTGYQRNDIVLVARTQLGYHEGNGTNELHGGNTTGTGNYTEYGNVANNINGAWGGFFVNWCARQVGFNQNFMWMTPKAFDRNSVKVGDIVSMRNGENLGIVISITGSQIIIVEGNYSNSVKATTYLLTDSDLTGYISPNYGTWSPQLLYYK